MRSPCPLSDVSTAPLNVRLVHRFALPVVGLTRRIMLRQSPVNRKRLQARRRISSATNADFNPIRQPVTLKKRSIVRVAPDHQGFPEVAESGDAAVGVFVFQGGPAPWMPLELQVENTVARLDHVPVFQPA